MNVQVIADPAGRLIWASPALPGARHDMGAAREHGIVEAINTAGVPAVADTAYRAAAPRYACRSVAVAWIRHRPLPAAVPQPAGGQHRARPPARPRRTSQRRAEELEDPPQIRASPSRATPSSRPFSP